MLDIEKQKGYTYKKKYFFQKEVFYMRKNFGAKDWLYPLPVLIVGSYDENGKANAMNAAWGGIYDDKKVILCLSQGHKTTKNIKKTGAFTVSFATAETVVACDYVGIASGNKEENKMEKAGFTVTKSEFVDAPIINELPMALECKLVGETADGNLIGEIININAEESVLDEEGLVDIKKLRPITFDPVHNTYVELGETVGKAFSDGMALK